MSPETVIVKAGTRTGPSKLGSSYIGTAIVSPWGESQRDRILTCGASQVLGDTPILPEKRL